jgi:hypothetical protein
MSATEPTDKVAATKTITNDILGYLLGLSDFSDMDEAEIYEQLYIWEPEIGGAIDRMSTMVGESYKYFYIKDTDEKRTKIEDKMVAAANKLADELDVRHYFEIFSELLSMHGNVYLENTDDLTVSILPNRYVTLIDNKERLINSQEENNLGMITQANFLVLYEGDTDQRIIPKGQFTHVKYKATPIFSKDNMGRTSYGVYAASPLHRVVLPVWWKRQTMIIDIMWRLRNVPREHHMISAEMFSLDKYAGDLQTRRTAAYTDATTFLQTYVEQIKNQMPDQGYATLDTTKIEMIENRNSNYMQTNELIAQINEQIWAVLNMPKSMVAGESHSSYASELIISNYVAQKVVQLAQKIKPVILDNIRKRLLLENRSYPVDQLDIKLELNIAATDIERMRQIALMVDTGLYTETELRERSGYKKLREDQRKELISKPVSSGSTSIPGGSSPYPDTPASKAQRPNDASTRSYREDKR